MKRRLFAIALIVCALLLAVLGAWQLQRLSWKLDLVRQVEARIHAAPRDLENWAGIGPEDAYLRVRVRGVFIRDRATFVKALTEYGEGWWLLTPLMTNKGVVLVNRGYVPDAAGDYHTATDEAVTVTGLVRASEPGGGFLRDNDPDADRWYSRDVAAIARKRGLSNVAPVFIDAEGDGAAGATPYPKGGLTVVRFSNPHLVYALTWFALSGLCVAGVCLLYRREIMLTASKVRQRDASPDAS